MKLIEVPILDKLQSDLYTYAAWGSDLSFDQLMYRETEMGRTRWSQNHMRCWTWVNESGEVVSSFETFRMFLPEGGTFYGIASVVTPLQHRKKGHATRMLAAGIERIESEDPNCRGWHLYSEVGSAIYERLGFVAKESFDYILSPKRAEKLQSGVKFISHDEMKNDQLHWHFTRERVYREMIRPWRMGLPLFAGAKDSSGEIIWFVNHRYDYLQVLLVGGDLSVSLVSAMRDYAARMGLIEIKMWSTESLTNQSLESLRACGAVSRERPDTIAMIRGIHVDDWNPCSRLNWV